MGIRKYFLTFLCLVPKIIKKLKLHLVRSKLPDLDELGRSQPCGGKRPPCHLCENIKDTCTFKCKHLDEIHKTNKKYNCNSKMVVYLIECQISNILEVQNLSLV